MTTRLSYDVVIILRFHLLQGPRSKVSYNMWKTAQRPPTVMNAQRKGNRQESTGTVVMTYPVQMNQTRS